MPPLTADPCPLCGAQPARPFAQVRQRDYHHCPRCQLVYLQPAQRLAARAERAHYETHENDPGDRGYRQFLNRLAAPLVARLPAGARGLDYGCGPGPALATMLAEQGFPTAIYDPFFAPDPQPLRHTYDFITCSETIEHFYQPGREFARLNTLLRPDGWLGLMTQMRRDECAFERWQYVSDPTHVCFYHAQTMHWLAAHFGWTLHAPQPTVTLFHKPPSAL